MAKFELAHKITARNEGGYANDPADRGGETYAGIARNFWPNWSGWATIDLIKKTYGKDPATINKYARIDQGLKSSIFHFYKQAFWDVNKLGLIESQEIANQLYDIGVNMGTSVAAKFLQKAIIPAVVVDGIIGTKTIAGVNGMKDPRTVYAYINLQRKNKYDAIIEANPSQLKFKKAWYSRIVPFEKALI